MRPTWEDVFHVTVVAVIHGPILDFIFGVLPGPYARLAEDLISPTNPAWVILTLSMAGLTLLWLGRRRARKEDRA